MRCILRNKVVGVSYDYSDDSMVIPGAYPRSVLVLLPGVRGVIVTEPGRAAVVPCILLEIHISESSISDAAAAALLLFLRKTDVIVFFGRPSGC